MSLIIFLIQLVATILGLLWQLPYRTINLGGKCPTITYRTDILSSQFNGKFFRFISTDDGVTDGCSGNCISQNFQTTNSTSMAISICCEDRNQVDSKCGKTIGSGESTIGDFGVIDYVSNYNKYRANVYIIDIGLFYHIAYFCATVNNTRAEFAVVAVTDLEWAEDKSSAFFSILSANGVNMTNVKEISQSNCSYVF